MSSHVPPSPYLLPDEPHVDSSIRLRVERDYERFAAAGLPDPLEDYLRYEYGLDVSAEFAGVAIPNPWGKASGQLSMTARQVADDVQAGLGFVVLKTVIAEDESGTQSMQAWAIPESRMVVEPITGRSGETGWTVSWKGRGWWQSFDDYLQLIREARDIADGTPTLIVPSCKFHLPTPEEIEWNVAEYDVTIQRLLEAWSGNESEPMPLEKDFSPTLAGSNRAAAESNILEWLRVVPELVHQAAQRAGHPVRLGLKMFNALFDESFQRAMLRAIHEPAVGSSSRAEFFTYGNRLFDPQREFEGHRGIAYGGPDLSDRNLRVLSQFQAELAAGTVAGDLLPFSATGNITTGRMALEYALHGAGSFQLHTFFQLGAEQYRLKSGSKTQKALHELYFHPQTGFVIWMHHLAGRLGLPRTPLPFQDVIGQGPLL